MSEFKQKVMCPNEVLSSRLNMFLANNMVALCEGTQVELQLSADLATCASLVLHSIGYVARHGTKAKCRHEHKLVCFQRKPGDTHIVSCGHDVDVHNNPDNFSCSCEGDIHIVTVSIASYADMK